LLWKKTVTRQPDERRKAQRHVISAWAENVSHITRTVNIHKI